MATDTATIIIGTSPTAADVNSRLAIQSGQGEVVQSSAFVREKVLAELGRCGAMAPSALVVVINGAQVLSAEAGKTWSSVAGGPAMVFSTGFEDRETDLRNALGYQTGDPEAVIAMGKLCPLVAQFISGVGTAFIPNTYVTLGNWTGAATAADRWRADFGGGA